MLKADRYNGEFGVHKLFVVVLFFILLVISACSEKTVENRQDKERLNLRKLAHGEASTKTAALSLVDVIKKKNLPPYPSIPIGKAFDTYRYFTTHEWTETRADNGKVFIDFVGWFDEKSTGAATGKGDLSAKGLAVKFVVEKDGTFGVVMISRLEKKPDGKMDAYPLEDIKGILDKIFGNTEIRF